MPGLQGPGLPYALIGGSPKLPCHEPTNIAVDRCEFCRMKHAGLPSPANAEARLVVCRVQGAFGQCSVWRVTADRLSCTAGPVGALALPQDSSYLHIYVGSAQVSTIAGLRPQSSTQEALQHGSCRHKATRLGFSGSG